MIKINALGTLNLAHAFTTVLLGDMRSVPGERTGKPDERFKSFRRWRPIGAAPRAGSVDSRRREGGNPATGWGRPPSGSDRISRAPRARTKSPPGSTGMAGVRGSRSSACRSPGSPRCCKPNSQPLSTLRAGRGPGKRYQSARLPVSACRPESNERRRGFSQARRSAAAPISGIRNGPRAWRDHPAADVACSLPLSARSNTARSNAACSTQACSTQARSTEGRSPHRLPLPWPIVHTRPPRLHRRCPRFRRPPPSRRRRRGYPQRHLPACPPP